MEGGFRRGRSGRLANNIPAEFGFTFNRGRHGEILDFTDARGDTYVLGEGERMVFTQDERGVERGVTIKLADGREVPFEEWRQGKLPN